MPKKKTNKFKPAFKEMAVQTKKALKERLRPGALDYQDLPSLNSDAFDTAKHHDPYMDQVRHKKE